MTLMHCALGAAFTLGLGISEAALNDRGNGLIYDDDLGITWMADASLSVTNTFGAAGVINPTGTMNWQTAHNWIDAMNAQAYLGFDNWRLPSTRYPDPSCEAVSGGHGCTGSEMGHLFYDELGGVAGQDIAVTHNSNYALFQNIQSNMYWSATGFTLAPSTPNDNAWTFYFPGGVQSTLAVENFAAVWAVREGDVALVPEPDAYALALVGLGVVWLAASRRKRAVV